MSRNPNYLIRVQEYEPIYLKGGLTAQDVAIAEIRRNNRRGFSVIFDINSKIKLGELGK